MDYDTISKMKVPELKSYLVRRGLKVTGRKCELVSRVFAAVENDVPVIMDAKEIEGQLLREYQDKLKYEGKTLPDPFKLATGWKDEDEGICFWPLVPTLYIINFLMRNSQVEDLNDYKASKAYSYFRQGWLGLISYHSLGNSPYCFMKTDCRPSQKLSDTKHKLWLFISKSEGKVLQTHCTCMAGMGSTCNHIAAALFHIEAAMRLGLINPACTSKSCEWLPNRKEVTPCKVKDMNLNRDNFSKCGKKPKKLMSTPKKNYNPLMRSSLKPLNFMKMVETLDNVLKGTTLETAIPKPEIDFAREVVDIPKAQTKTIPSVDDIILMSSSVEQFLQNLFINFSDENLKMIEKITCGQSTNERWFEFRKGVITASKVHEVLTKMRKIVNGFGGGCVNMWSLIQKISGLTFVNPNIPALKYGRDMEPHAANKLLELLKTSHKNVKLEECGLHLLKSNPYIGASPDRIFSCSCHGKSCVEIKCPYSISHLSPMDDNVKLDYLENDHSKIQLKKHISIIVSVSYRWELLD